MPGNHSFNKRVEYTTLAYYYLGRYGYGVTQFFFQFSLAFNNISSIIQSVQVMDFAIVAIAGKSCAIPEVCRQTECSSERTATAEVPQ